MKYLLIDIYSGVSEFNDSNHIKNFVNYLFSETRKHIRIPETDYNTFYIITPETKNIFQNNIKNKTKKMQINKHLFEINVSNLFNDLFYILYAFESSGEIYSNFLYKDGDNVVINISDELLENLNISEDFLIKKVEKFLNEINVEKCQFFDMNITKNLGKYNVYFDELIHKYINNKYKENVIYGFSHQDQGIYHIHRICKKI